MKCMSCNSLNWQLIEQEVEAAIDKTPIKVNCIIMQCNSCGKKSLDSCYTKEFIRKCIEK